VLCSALLWQQTPERVLLRMRADLLQQTASQLARYAALSRVTIEAAPLRVIGLLGVPDRARTAGVIDAWPEAELAIRAQDDAWLLDRDRGGARHELWVPAGSIEAWEARLATIAGAGDAQRWRRALVLAGEAEVQAATRELFLPQMLDYDRDGTVSFRKGCYTGQEVVARTHYRGGVKRHLRQLCGSGAPPAPGSAVHAGERLAGTVAESASDGGDGFLLLAVLGDEAIDAEKGQLQGEGGVPLRLPA
jgi:folate-binding protein YgfZ